MVNDAFCRWASDRLLTQLRSGELPDDIHPGDLTFSPMSEILRSTIAPGDRDLALRLASDPASVMWGALLARAFHDDDALTAALLSSFATEPIPERRLGLFHHLTARRLSDADRANLAAWLEEHLDEFVEEQRVAFSDGPARLYARIESEVPGMAEKRWVYMYSLLSLPPNEARTAIERFVDDADPAVARAARHALGLADSVGPGDTVVP